MLVHLHLADVTIAHDGYGGSRGTNLDRKKVTLLLTLKRVNLYTQKGFRNTPMLLIMVVLMHQHGYWSLFGPKMIPYKSFSDFMWFLNLSLQYQHSAISENGMHINFQSLGIMVNLNEYSYAKVCITN